MLVLKYLLVLITYLTGKVIMSLTVQIANGLSTITIVSCMFLKLPQIQHIRETRCAEGLYLRAIILEILGFTIMTLYNFTNSYSVYTYLEYPIILVQVYVMAYYVLKIRRLDCCSWVWIVTIAYFMAVIGFATGHLPKDVLGYAVPFCTPLSGFAKVTYMYGIIMSCNADAISLTTWVISVATNLARVFTVYVDSADLKLMVNFTISAFLSTGVLVTAIIYKCKRPRRARSPYCRHKSHCD